MAGGRIVQYGRRTKRALEAGSLKRPDDTAQRAASPAQDEHPAPAPAPASSKQLRRLRDENVISAASSTFSASDSPQPKPARRARKKMIVSSPSTSPVMSSKIRRVNPPVKPIQRPTTERAVERVVLAPASGNVPRKAATTTGKSFKRLADAKSRAVKPTEDIESILLAVARPIRPVVGDAGAPTTPARPMKSVQARKLTPKKSPVELDIVVMDDDGRQHSHEKRVSRPDVVVNAATGPSRQTQTQPPRLPGPVLVADENSDKPAVVSLSKNSPRRSRLYVLANPSGGSSGKRSTVTVPKPRPTAAPPRSSVVSLRSVNVKSSAQAPVNVQHSVPALLTQPPAAGPSRRALLRPIRPSEPIIVISDSEEEEEEIVRPPARSSRKLRIESDESGSDEAPPQLRAHQLASPSTTSSTRRSMEVASARDSLRLSSATTDPATSASRLSTYIPPSRPVFVNRALPPSPPAHTRKTRPLSPVLRGQHPRPPGPSSPSSTDGFDDSFDLETELQRLEIGSSSTTPEPASTFDACLQPLLAECDQPEPFEFSSFISTFPFDPVVAGRGADIGFQKIGEASYSEVFGIGDVVLKVVPLRSEATGQIYQAQGVETPPPSEPGDVLKEILVTRTMGNIAQGFVKLLRTYVVRGKYPSLLLDLWDDYNGSKGSESIRPDMFTASQTYAIIVLPNGGPDLETYIFEHPMKTAWRQASSIFWQVARALASAEDLVSFEHRDLHWGQILVRDISKKAPSKRRVMDDPNYGVQATVIDLGLARMSGHDGATEPTWTPFDEEIFEGEGDYQFDIYRLMRAHHGRDWSCFRPLTNVMWLHYLTRKLLKSKGLRAPPIRKSTSTFESSSEFSERDCYEALAEVDELLGRTLEVLKKPSRKGRRMTQAAAKVADISDVRDAQGVLAFGMKRGWIRA
ncbi:unnamed protein product [Peniophora sp. CBMAI 1063]|nr:unnamed protein product [Peniophora sp. CBMAI 1063]